MSTFSKPAALVLRYVKVPSAVQPSMTVADSADASVLPTDDSNGNHKLSDANIATLRAQSAAHTPAAEYPTNDLVVRLVYAGSSAGHAWFRGNANSVAAADRCVIDSSWSTSASSSGPCRDGTQTGPDATDYTSSGGPSTRGPAAWGLWGNLGLLWMESESGIHVYVGTSASHTPSPANNIISGHKPEGYCASWNDDSQSCSSTFAVEFWVH